MRYGYTISVLYFLAIILLIWSVWLFLYQYIAVFGSFEEVIHGFGNDRVLSALWLSITSAFVTAFLGIVFGVPLAYLFATKEFRSKTILETVCIDVPQTFPPIAEGLILMLMLGPNSPFHVNLSLTFAALVIAKLYVSGPFIIAFTTRKFQEIQLSGLDVTAQTLGANPMQIFRTVYLPLAFKDILAGVAICWSRAMGELGGSMIFAGVIPYKTEIIPTLIATNPTAIGLALASTILVTSASALSLVTFKTLVPGTKLWKAFFYKV